MAAEMAVPDRASVMARFEAVRTGIDIETSLEDGGSLDEWIKGKLVAILDAPDFEAMNAVMTQSGLTSAKSLVGRALEIQDFATRESAEQYREKSALQKYALVQCVDTSTGEDFIMDGGGDQFVAGLIGMRERYGFPFTGTLLTMTTGSGNELQYWRFHDPKRKPAPVIR